MRCSLQRVRDLVVAQVAQPQCFSSEQETVVVSFATRACSGDLVLDHSPAGGLQN